jgi:ACT domain-containing protein
MRKKIVTKSKLEKMEKLIVGDKPLRKQGKSSNKKNRELGAENKEQGPGSTKLLPNVTLRHSLVGEKGYGSVQLRQVAFLEAFRSNFWNVSQACQAVGISRQTYYRWRKDQSFQENLNDCQEELKDFIRGKLLELIANNNLIAIIFGCKTICGMVEAQGKQSISMEHSFHTKEMTDRVVSAFEQSRNIDIKPQQSDTQH